MTEERLEGLQMFLTFKEQGYDGFIDGADRAIACATDVRMTFISSIYVMNLQSFAAVMNLSRQ